MTENTAEPVAETAAKPVEKWVNFYEREASAFTYDSAEDANKSAAGHRTALLKITYLGDRAVSAEIVEA